MRHGIHWLHVYRNEISPNVSKNTTKINSQNPESMVAKHFKTNNTPLYNFIKKYNFPITHYVLKHVQNKNLSFIK